MSGDESMSDLARATIDDLGQYDAIPMADAVQMPATTLNYLRHSEAWRYDTSIQYFIRLGTQWDHEHSPSEI